MRINKNIFNNSKYRFIKKIATYYSFALIFILISVGADYSNEKALYGELIVNAGKEWYKIVQTWNCPSSRKVYVPDDEPTKCNYSDIDKKPAQSINEYGLSKRQQYAAYTHYHRRRPPY